MSHYTIYLYLYWL